MRWVLAGVTLAVLVLLLYVTPLQSYVGPTTLAGGRTAGFIIGVTLGLLILTSPVWLGALVLWGVVRWRKRRRLSREQPIL